MALDFDAMKKEAILKKTKEFIAEKGMENFSMDKLAAYCGLAKGTFYNYFKSKDELLSRVVEFSVNDIWQVLIKETEKTESPEEKLRIVIKLSIEFFRDNRDILILYANEVKMSECVVPTEDSVHGQFMLNHLNRVFGLIKGIAESLGVSNNLDKLAFAIHELLVNFNKYYIFYGKQADVERDTDFLFNFILKGMEGVK